MASPFFVPAKTAALMVSIGVPVIVKLGWVSARIRTTRMIKSWGSGFSEAEDSLDRLLGPGEHDEVLQ